ncbi:MAG: hypothetical protein IPP71_00050 [Bacteroidetes bacterium]|nr:hypothetical protein [Bacteroidota bacterium]
MKKIIIVFIFFAVSAISCKNDSNEIPSPAATTGKVIFVFKNEVDGNAIQIGAMNNTNEAGNVYSVDEMRYYISNIVFVTPAGVEFKAPNYELIIEDSAETKYFVVENVPFGNYDSLKFLLGVDSAINTIGALTGDLDPINSMFWDWQSGYINFKHEGMFIDSTGNPDFLTYHFGTLKGTVDEVLPINLNFTEGTKIINITFNLNKIYRSPNVINFNGENIHQSTGPGENGWLQLMRENFQGAFEVTSIQ